MGTIVKYPLQLSQVRMQLELLELGVKRVTRILPSYITPPAGAVSLGSDGFMTEWSYNEMQYRPVAVELISRFDGSDILKEGTCKASLNSFISPIEFDQASKARHRHVIPTRSFVEMPTGITLNWRLNVPHHSITVLQEASAQGLFDKTISATFSGSISSGNTLVAHLGYWYGNSATTFAVANTAGSYTVTHTQTYPAGFGACQATAYRYTGASEGLSQDLTVTSSSNENPTIYVIEVSGIRQASPLDDTMQTNDDGVTAQSQASGTSGTLEALEKLILFGYTLNAPVTGRSYGNDDGSPPTEVNVNELPETWVNTYTAQKIRSSTTAAGSTLSWTSAAKHGGGIGIVLAAEDSVSPIAFAPAYRLQTSSSETTFITQCTVAEPGDPITSVEASCTSGDISFTPVGSCTISNNGTSTATIENGASLQEFNQTLATMLYQGDVGFHGKDTVTITASDGTLTGQATFDVLNDPHTLTVTFSGTQAQGVAAIETTYATMLSGTSETLNMVTTDAGSLSDNDNITLNAETGNPVIVSNGGGSTASFDVQGGVTYATTVVATDPNQLTLTYSITGGSDQSLFTIGSSTGILTFLSAPDYHNPGDSDTNNTYLVNVQVTNGTSTDSQDLTITVVNSAPAITSNGGGSTANVTSLHMQKGVTTVEAMDANNDTLTYSITGGVDQSLFTINSSTGFLSFITAPDIESPTDANADNVYVVTVQVSDGELTDSQTLSVTVSHPFSLNYLTVNEITKIYARREIHKVYARSEQPGSIKRSTGHGHTVS